MVLEPLPLVVVTDPSFPVEVVLFWAGVVVVLPSLLVVVEEPSVLVVVLEPSEF